MRKKKMYDCKCTKLIAMCLCVILATSLLTGCKSGKDKGTSNSMGRYMEQELELPKGYEISNIISILSNSDNQLEIYVGTSNGVVVLTYDGKDWSEKDSTWINSLDLEPDMINRVVLGKDNNYYLVVADYGDEDTKYAIYKADKEKAKKIEIPWLETKAENSFNEVSYPCIEDLQVLEDGTLVIIPTVYGESVNMFDPSTGELLEEYTITTPVAIIGHEIIGYSTEQQKLLRMDKNANEIASYDYDAAFNSSLLEEKNENLYSLSSDGISVLQKDGSLWQTIVEGDLTTLSDRTMTFKNLTVMEKEKTKAEYAVLAYDSQYNVKLFYYYFDENVTSVPSTQMNVYSLYLNPTVRLAIIKYQAEHPEVLIKYTYAIESGEAGNTNLSDTIRALNTELMAGNGADILVLDGLPRDAYVEKGVLEDLSNLIKPLVDDGTLSKNIMQNYLLDSGCYYVPLRFQVPLAYGNKKLVQAMPSLDDMLALLESKENMGLFNNIGAKNFANLFYALYNKELVSDDKTINEENLGKYLDMLQLLMDKMGDEDIYGFRMSSLQVDNAIELDRGFNMYFGESTKNDTFVEQLLTLPDCQAPLAGVREAGMYYDTLDKQFVESGVIGVNKASKNKELAKEFLSYLLAEKVQSCTAFDGFPVNAKSLDVVMNDAESLNGMALAVDSDVMEIKAPTKKQVQELYGKIKELDKPISYDCMLSSLVIEQVKDFLEGKVSKDEAIQNIMNVANGYLAE
jgi:ABC-type glycerol-3-phosphate transport system substrate-binding protein